MTVTVETAKPVAVSVHCLPATASQLGSPVPDRPAQPALGDGPAWHKFLLDLARPGVDQLDLVRPDLYHIDLFRPDLYQPKLVCPGLSLDCCGLSRSLPAWSL